MNEYEIFSVVVCIILTFSLIWIVQYFLDRIKRLEDKIEKLYLLNDGNDGKLERLEDDIYALMDRKEDKK